jgi:hypothetical protein
VLLEQRAVETTRAAIINVLDGRLVAQFGNAQSRYQPFSRRHDVSRSSNRAILDG